MASKNSKGATEARVLVDCALGKCNDYVTGAPELIAAHYAAGEIDTDADAVAWAKANAAEKAAS